MHSTSADRVQEFFSRSSCRNTSFDRESRSVIYPVIRCCSEIPVLELRFRSDQEQILICAIGVILRFSLLSLLYHILFKKQHISDKKTRANALSSVYPKILWVFCAEIPNNNAAEHTEMHSAAKKQYGGSDNLTCTNASDAKHDARAFTECAVHQRAVAFDIFVSDISLRRTCKSAAVNTPCATLIGKIILCQSQCQRQTLLGDILGSIDILQILKGGVAGCENAVEECIQIAVTECFGLCLDTLVFVDEVERTENRIAGISAISCSKPTSRRTGLPKWDAAAFISAGTDA